MTQTAVELRAVRSLVESKEVVDRYRHYLGEAAVLLDEPDVTDISRNPQDSRIWAISNTRGKVPTPYQQTTQQAEGMIGAIVAEFNTEFNYRNPLFLGVLPYHGARFTAARTPVVGGVMWTIRKPNNTVLTFQDYLDAGIIPSKDILERIRTYISERKNILVAGPMGVGKALDVDTPLLTPDGWVRMGDIKLGDRVMGRDGQPATVRGVFPQGKRPAFRVTFNDGSSTVCCDDHLWMVRTAEAKCFDYPWSVKKLKELRKQLTLPYDNGCKWFIPVAEPMQFPKQDLPIDPYVLGSLLGDGSFRTGQPYGVRFTTADQETVEALRLLLPAEDELRPVGATRYPNEYRVTRKKRNNQPSRVGTVVSELGLAGKASHQKHIPPKYLFSSCEDRLALLQGLMDTDGTVSVSNNVVEFYTVSEQLARDVAFLIRSLGGVARKRIRMVTPYMHKGERRVGQPCHRILCKLPKGMTPFRLARKANLYQPHEKYTLTRGILSVEPIGERNMQCISVDSPDNLFVIEDFIVTHNTTLANTLIAEIDRMNKGRDRWIIIEDTDELRCSNPDHVKLLTNSPLGINWSDLIAFSLRTTGTRIVLGEIRSAARSLLEAWQVGAVGNVATIHGDNADDVMRRFESLLLKEGGAIDRHEISKTIGAIIVIGRVGVGRKVKDVVRIQGVTEHGYSFRQG